VCVRVCGVCGVCVVCVRVGVCCVYVYYISTLLHILINIQMYIHKCTYTYIIYMST